MQGSRESLHFRNPSRRKFKFLSCACPWSLALLSPLEAPVRGTRGFREVSCLIVEDRCRGRRSCAVIQQYVQDAHVFMLQPCINSLCSLPPPLLCRLPGSYAVPLCWS